MSATTDVGNVVDEIVALAAGAALGGAAVDCESTCTVAADIVAVAVGTAATLGTAEAASPPVVVVVVVVVFFLPRAAAPAAELFAFFMASGSCWSS